MKGLTIEQKAKAYDLALDRAKKLYEQGTITESLSYVFPELKESGDERIRKFLHHTFTVQYLAQDELGKWHGEPVSNILAWLEKQGEPVEINPTEFDTRLQSLIGKFDSLPKEELIGSLSFWLNVVQNDGTYKKEKQGEVPVTINIDKMVEDYANNEECDNEGFGKPVNCMIRAYRQGLTDAIVILNLRKQGEQNLIMAKSPQLGGQRSTDKIEPRFKIGDVVCDKSCTTLNKDKQPNLEIVDIKGGLYICDKGYIPISYQDEYELVAKKIEAENETEIPFGAKDSELQEATYFIPKGFHAEIDDDKVVIKKGEKPITWSEEDKKMSRFIGNAITADDSSVYLKNKGIEVIDAHVWLDELKDRVQPQPKQEENKGNLGGISSNWSEEDETGWTNTMIMIKEVASNHYTKDSIKLVVNFLKSLKDKYTWKPSKKQMEALKDACDEHWEPDGLDPLYTLYQELKELREE